MGLGADEEPKTSALYGVTSVTRQIHPGAGISGMCGTRRKEPGPSVALTYQLAGGPREHAVGRVITSNQTTVPSAPAWFPSA